LNILEVLASTPSEVGGIENVVFNLSTQMIKLGHRVTVMVPYKRSSMWSAPRGTRIKHIPTFGINSRFEAPLSFKSIRKELEVQDVCHIHSIHSLFSLLTLQMGRISSCAMVASILSLFGLMKHPNRLMRICLMPIEAGAVLSLKALRCVHVKNREDLFYLTRLHCNVYYIPDGIPDAYFTTPAKPNALHDLVDRRGEMLLYVGRLHPMKGVHILLRALKLVLKANPDVYLVIIGEGEIRYKAMITDLINQLDLRRDVVMLGWQPEEVKIMAYDAARVVVIPSIADIVEAFSLVASEAWARGKPVAASAVGALKVRVKPGLNGYLAYPSDPLSLAQSIGDCMRLKEVVSPEDVVKWSQVALEFEKMYEEALDE